MEKGGTSFTSLSNTCLKPIPVSREKKFRKSKILLSAIANQLMIIYRLGMHANLVPRRTRHAVNLPITCLIMKYKISTNLSGQTPAQVSNKGSKITSINISLVPTVVNF